MTVTDKVFGKCKVEVSNKTSEPVDAVVESAFSEKLGRALNDDELDQLHGRCSAAIEAECLDDALGGPDFD